MKNENKRKKIYLLILLMTFFFMFIGTTLAYFKFLGSQKEDSTKYYSGKLVIEYKDGVYVRNPKIYPKYNVDYNTRDGVYRNNFTIVSNGTLNQTIKIDFEVSKNEFVGNNIMYSLFNGSGKLMSTGNIPKTGIVTMAENLYMTPVEAASYTLIVWLRNNGQNQNYDDGKTITGKINVLSKQSKY